MSAEGWEKPPASSRPRAHAHTTVHAHRHIPPTLTEGAQLQVHKLCVDLDTHMHTCTHTRFTSHFSLKLHTPGQHQNVPVHTPRHRHTQFRHTTHFPHIAQHAPIRSSFSGEIGFNAYCVLGTILNTKDTMKKTDQNSSLTEFTFWWGNV